VNRERKKTISPTAVRQKEILSVGLAAPEGDTADDSDD